MVRRNTFIQQAILREKRWVTRLAAREATSLRVVAPPAVSPVVPVSYTHLTLPTNREV